MQKQHDIQFQLETRFKTAIIAALGDDFADSDPMIRVAADAKFGDFQANAAMGLAKRAGSKPRDLATKIVEQLQAEEDAAQWYAKLEIAGPGFINVTLQAARLVGQLTVMASDDQLGVTPASPPQRVVIDYSGPNVAKEMHIGHLRSTIIGDAIGRTLAFQGHEVIRQNHLGDWGTQFGMLIEHLLDIKWDPNGGDHAISDLNALYQASKKHFDDDADFATRARQRVVALQSGDETTLTIWRGLIEESKRHFNAVYQALGVKLTDDDIRPESFYNDKLSAVVDALDDAKLLHESDGAAVVYPEGYKDRDGNQLGMIVRKRDGGFGYAATDLAAVRFRVSELGADRVVYVVDSRQKDHFGQVFWTVRAAGWDTIKDTNSENKTDGFAGENVGGGVRLDYVPFGTIMGKDRKPFKTRTGGTVKLAEVLDEAIERAGQVIAAKNPELGEAERSEVARAVGLGGIKYADLSNDRIKDYIFDWDRMLALEGNTAPYLQYSYTRIRSIFRKAGDVNAKATITIGEPAERQLALQLLQFPGVIDAVADSLEPHRLCTYLYELATLYHRFYEQCPVLKADDDTTRDSRLALCDLVGRTLQRGLGLLGISTVEQM